jgi:hypothetical protein
MPDLSLKLLSALIEAHEELVLALEDYINSPLNVACVNRLQTALKKSRDLINKSED